MPNHAVLLSDILQRAEAYGAQAAHMPKDLGSVVAGIHFDSRDVCAGGVFVAVKGEHHNGEKFIRAACAKEVGAVVCAAEAADVFSGEFPNVLFLSHEYPGRLGGLLAGLFYPDLPKTMVGVTGTNGKTSVVEFVRQLWAMEGLKSASMGTLGVIPPHKDIKIHNTTPPATTTYATLNALKGDGFDHVALEASSHGLEQGRLEGLSFQRLGFTNLTQDHLDYHKTFEDYFAAKQRLFTALSHEDCDHVINIDDPKGIVLHEMRPKHTLTYGRASAANMRLCGTETRALIQHVTLNIFGQTIHFKTSLLGAFQIYNILCALGLAFGQEGLEARLSKIQPMLEHLKGIPGRMEYVGASKNGGRIYVDYAHTPDALAHALDVMREATEKRIVVVFGCGGNRDVEKRPKMGKVAAEKADLICITDDNPRFENPSLIREDILKACPGATEIAARQDAIAWGIQQLQEAGDVLLIAGKGHEQGQTVRDVVHPFDDRIAVRQVLEAE